ncbi:accessory Sec system glycosyltransferase GtfA [Staphylococcus delphini]|uniref:accessory Sec system glycosyltransferase GtfA n=1 Tax=Staphylococcus delphini TaxID=53344 RepID=UPI000BBBBED5|nr:accessory Sec system glycosyltransferase GtfA [Staphylococcus delphini]PCF49393.1 accessory Sec system glycosyltransferase GtfA [Staphylococcus delphini]PCF76564.1 accessory Sec system glycosyltransferase GtfA [Staphylococcus delphini]
MTIYNINFGIGWASSGVEYAQSYRAQLLRLCNEDAKFIFLDLIAFENIQTLTANLGFKDEEIIWLYQYFTDIPIAPTTYTLQDLERELGQPITYIEDIGKVQRLYFQYPSQTFVTCYLKNEGEPYVNRAEFVVNGMLIRKDFFSYVRTFSEYYAPSDQRAKLYMRQFYNEDGTIAYQEIIDGDMHMYRFQDAILYSQAELVAYFMQKLNLTADDIVLLDRASHIGQAVLQNKQASRIGVVIHAEHFSENATDGTHILWNNYYEYQFKNARFIDFYIVATELQNTILTAQFHQYTANHPRIYTIPVGSLMQLTYPTKARTPYAVITASRLASEKHVDWIAMAVIKAKQHLPEIQLDIFGHGPERDRIEKVIQQYNAENYIHLKGHVDLTHIYAQYELFVSASQSEGFGLTLMEAVGSGLGLIGFNVNYGNPTFIQDGHNGYLLETLAPNETIDAMTDRMADKIVQYFQHGPTDPHATSYAIAKHFETTEIVKQWQNVLEEVRA